MTPVILVLNAGSSSVKFSVCGGPRISPPGQVPSAWVIPTDEELMIARQSARLLHAPAVPAAQRLGSSTSPSRPAAAVGGTRFM